MKLLTFLLGFLMLATSACAESRGNLFRRVGDGNGVLTGGLITAEDGFYTPEAFGSGGLRATGVVGCAGNSSLEFSSNNLYARNCFDFVFLPNDNNGRVYPGYDALTDLGTASQRWKTIYSTGVSVSGIVTATHFEGDGSRLTGVGGGARNFFVVHPSGTQNFATGGSTVNTLVSFTVPGVSSSAAFASQFNVSTSTFTPSTTGVYNFRARLVGFFPSATANSFVFYYIYSGTTPVAFCPGPEADTNNYNSVVCSATLQLTAGANVTMKYSANGTAYRVDNGNSYFNELYIEKIQ